MIYSEFIYDLKIIIHSLFQKALLIHYLFAI